uniref:NADH-ubiquinone oxidoreductase chain 2 n=1 Tax=Bilobella aurantiaca TaxID=106915 RepID=B5KMC0_BILAU|nr:NADH dehydrogenase subunit 2 [Bilobella aurantiaca]ABS88963.1 NADH dehydrogenase subunit 2 [Bilobella aurantiaca]
MFFNYKMLFIYPSLFFGTLIAMSSSSWVSAWMGLEINLMSMAPILISKFKSKSMEATIKYFIFQAIASSLMIFFIFLSMMNSYLSLNMFTELIITASLIFKAGMAPLQFWFPQVINFSEWIPSILLMTWQKLAPFTLLMYLNSSILIWSIMLSALVGMLGGINQFNFKFILVYSSILHSAWLLCLILCSNMFWVMYMCFYTFISLSVILFLYKFNIVSVSSPFLLKEKMFKLMFISNFLSLAGMPPFLGFSMKIISIFIFFNSDIFKLIISILILSSFISLYFYLRTIYTSFILLNWNISTMNSVSYNFKLKLILFSILSILGNIFFPMAVLLT